MKMVLIGLHIATVLGLFGPGRAPIANILGVSVGDSFDAARERLEKVAEPSGKKDEGEEDMVAFTLKGSPYKVVVLHGSDEKVSWISAFARDPAGIPFATFGDLGAGKVTDSLATWEVHDPTHTYRVLARGSNGRASVITLLRPMSRIRQ